jgi:hypothetical protein
MTQGRCGTESPSGKKIFVETYAVKVEIETYAVNTGAN